jgi:hypothetical protein
MRPRIFYMKEDIVMISKDPLVGLGPALLWKYFSEIVSIPRD